jgi:hypothetical protein
VNIVRENIVRETPQHAEPERTDGATLTRRRILGGLAALPAIYGIASASSALAAADPVATATRPRGSVPNAGDALVRRNGSDDLVRGVERRYNAPLLTPGTRLVLPADIKAVPVHDYYRRPHLASTESAWPRVKASDGTTVDASIVPERGAPTRIAILSGFTEGWYEVIHANGRADRVTWDARKLPFLWLYGEFGATTDAPYHRFYTLALEPFSRNPYSRNPLAA